MKDKLEVGHFIRTIKGIGRIEEITEDRTEIYFNCDTGLTISFVKKDFTQEEMAQYYKHSDNIIDLIEVGDYVNGWRVNRVEKEEEGTLLTVGTITSFVSRNETEPYLTQDYNEADKMCKLKSILTKEQFSSIEYKVMR